MMGRFKDAEDVVAFCVMNTKARERKFAVGEGK